MSLYRLVYRSEYAAGDREQAEAEMRDIAQRCDALNAASQVSSALLLSDRTIMQAIEGPLEAVEATFERICADARHKRLQLVDFSSVPERCFGEWPIAVVSTNGGLAALCGQPEALTGGRLDPLTMEAMLGLMRSLILTDGAGLQPQAAYG